jgi:hypothetical protein
MKFYLSYWTNKEENEIEGPLSIGNHLGYLSIPKSWIPKGASKKETDKIRKEYDFILKKKLTQSAVNALRKNYDEVYLITDYEGEKLFKDVGFKKIFNYLEDLPQEYREIWSLGKLKSYNIISKIGDPFFHIDYDFVIQNKFPDYIHKIPILSQSVEIDLEKLGYHLEKMMNGLTKKNFLNFSKPKIAYNSGITGGNDLDFFLKYSESALDIVFAEENKSFWLTPYRNLGLTHWSKSTFIEQYYYSASLEFLNKKGECFFELLAKEFLDENYEYFADGRLKIYEKLKIIHLHGAKKTDINLLKYIFPNENYELLN